MTGQLPEFAAFIKAVRADDTVKMADMVAGGIDIFWSPSILEQAYEAKAWKAASFLLDAGADTMIHSALRLGALRDMPLETFKKMVKKAGTEEGNRHVTSPGYILPTASLMGRWDIVEWRLKESPLPETTAHMFFVRTLRHHPEKLPLLAEHGIHFDFDLQHECIFDRVCVDRNEAGLRHLTAVSKDINKAFGLPPLLSAVAWGYDDGVRIILEAGASVMVKNAALLQMAKVQLQPETLQLLSEALLQEEEDCKRKYLAATAGNGIPDLCLAVRAGQFEDAANRRAAAGQGLTANILFAEDDSGSCAYGLLRAFGKTDLLFNAKLYKDPKTTLAEIADCLYGDEREAFLRKAASLTASLAAESNRKLLRKDGNGRFKL